MNHRSMRTITTPSPVTPERMHGGKAILEPEPSHSWESRVVLNPAAVLIEAGPELEALLPAWQLSEESRGRLRAAGGACVVIYRAQGEMEPEKQHAPSYLGLALFTPRLELVKRWPHPVLQPLAPFHNLGVEDPRCTRVGDTYYLYYTGYATETYGAPAAARKTWICLATTRDFLDWELRGPVSGDLNEVNNKNAALFPETIDGRWLLLHRPMEGLNAMAIHLAQANDPAGPWHSRGLLMKSYRYREFERSWIGAGGPPLALGDARFLMMYHQGHYTPEGAREYDLAVALLDFSAAHPVRSRIEPLMRPTGAAEQRGDPTWGVDNVLFTCANYRREDWLVIPYAAADSRIFGARLSFYELLATLEKKSAEVRHGKG